MKKTLALIILFILANKSFSQIIHFDELISIIKPENVEILDTTVKTSKLLRFVSNKNSDNFLIMRVTLDSNVTELSNLPFDKISLDKTYHEIMNGYIKKMNIPGLTFNDSIKINFKGFVAYICSYKSSQNKAKVNETLMLILNQYLYSFSYLNQSDFNEYVKNTFFESISVDSKSKPSQTIGKNVDYKIGYLAGTVLVFILIIGIIFFLIKLIVKK